MTKTSFKFIDFLLEMMLVKDTDPKFKSYDVIIQNVIQYNFKKSVS